MSGRPAARVPCIIAVALACALIAALIYAVMNRQLIQDQMAAARFNPTSQVQSLQQSLQLTESGERIFLASHPTLDGSQYFNTQCAEVQHGASGHVLGCFVDNHIHLYSVSDPRVAGIVEVTAAHELLHAAYARMQPGDRAALGKKLRDLYEKRAKNDPDLVERMSMYSGLSDAAFAAELHSVFGSERTNLPAWLEKHYAQWFKHRPHFAETYRSYRGVFQGIQSEAQTLRDQMDELRTDVETRKVAYDDEVAMFDSDSADFKTRQLAKEFKTNPEEEARLAQDLESRRKAIKETLSGLQDDVDRYNDMRADLEQLAALSLELDETLDSALAPITTRPNS